MFTSRCECDTYVLPLRRWTVSTSCRQLVRATASPVSWNTCQRGSSAGPTGSTEGSNQSRLQQAVSMSPRSWTVSANHCARPSRCSEASRYMRGRMACLSKSGLSPKLATCAECGPGHVEPERGGRGRRYGEPVEVVGDAGPNGGDDSASATASHSPSRPIALLVRAFGREFREDVLVARTDLSSHSPTPCRSARQCDRRHRQAAW